jgi:hypothetical protein
MKRINCDQTQEGKQTNQLFESTDTYVSSLRFKWNQISRPVVDELTLHRHHGIHNENSNLIVSSKSFNDQHSMQNNELLSSTQIHQ